jgi:hypothetical protein
MGQMRFLIPRPEKLVGEAAEQAYLAGAEGIPWECQVSLEGQSLVLERDTRESGYLHFPWKVPGRGVVQLSSGSLMERPRDYHLPVELARGTLNRVRNQAAQWQQAGMTIPHAFDEIVHHSAVAFGRAATGQHRPQAAQDYAEEAIRLGLEAGDLLSREYIQQVLAIRRGQQASLGTLLGARLQAPLAGDAATRFTSAFNTVAVGTFWPDLEPQLGKFNWDATDRLIEWCQQKDLRICVGPLVQMDKHALPDWLFLDEDFEEVQLSVLSFVESVVRRYRGKVHLWHVASGMNLSGALEHSEEQRLRLVVEAVDRVRAVDPRTPLVMSFAQPWGEYIARQDQELTPLHFADTLVRGELGLAGVGLEIHYGYWPGGTLPRDPLEVSRQLDRWSQIGVPLMVFVSAPSSAVDDPLARHPARALADLRAGGPTPAWQHVLVQWLLPMLLAKQSVQAIIWDNWQDSHPHEMPSSGLCDGTGAPKPVLRTLLELRREFVG